MNQKHGQANTRLYRIWANMKTRCTNPKATGFENWGGKGVRVFRDWFDFQKFQLWAITAGYSDNLTLDRIDPNGNYEPSNCRWATYSEQNYNKKCVPVYELNGVKFHQSEVESLFGIKRTTFQARLKRGWTLERAVS